MRRALGVAALFALLVAAVHADDAVDRPVNFTRLHAVDPFRFDADEGKDQIQVVPIDCSVDAIWLKTRFTGFGNPFKYAPLMALGIESATTRAMVMIYPYYAFHTLRVGVTTYDLSADQKVADATLYNALVLQSTVPVLASWSAEGVVTFKVGTESRSVDLKGPVSRAYVLGSTGRGLFDPLETGHISGSNAGALCPKTTP